MILLQAGPLGIAATGAFTQDQVMAWGGIIASLAISGFVAGYNKYRESKREQDSLDRAAVTQEMELRKKVVEELSTALTENNSQLHSMLSIAKDLTKQLADSQSKLADAQKQVIEQAAASNITPAPIVVIPAKEAAPAK